MKKIFWDAKLRPHPLGGTWHDTFWKSIKFELSGAVDDRSDPCRECGGCKNSVTLCGSCIDVTELGNIALGVAAGIGTLPGGILFDEPGTAIWGGFKIGLDGRGFDTVEDIRGGVLGAILRYKGFPAGNNNICDVLMGPLAFNLIDRLMVETWQQNNRWCVYTALPGGPARQDVLAEWDKKYSAALGGGWRTQLRNAFIDVLTQRADALSGKHKNCEPCTRLWMPSTTYSTTVDGSIIW